MEYGAQGGNDHIVVSLVDVVEEPGWDLESATAAAAIAAVSVAGATAGACQKAAVVTLNRPKMRNCVSLAMWKDLARIFTELGQDPQVRAIILTGAGGNFCAGADISEFATVRATVEQGDEYEVAVDDCCDAIANTPKPTIAVVNGFCMGGGCHLAMSCDFRFAAPEAQFGIPASRLSIVYGVRGTQRLFSLVGISNAKRILYSAMKFGSADAVRMGFLDRVAADPMRSAQSFAAVMADNAPLTISGTKVILNGLAMGMGVLTDEQVNHVVQRAVGSDDYRNARQAFVEKRQPVFLGK
jgi:enoyl-CoA hydratase/carnithine racemase